MPTNNAVLSAREAFEQGTAALAPTSPIVVKGKQIQQASQPAAGESAAGVTQNQTNAADGDTSVDDNIAAVDSSTTADVSGDENVDSSAVTDETAATDDSYTADTVTSETSEQQPVRPRSRAQERIEDLVASNKALKASLDYLQNQVIEKLKPAQQSQITQQTEQQATAVVADEAPPTLESVGFDTDKWTQAMHAWTRKQIASGVQQAVQTVQQNQTEAQRKAAFESRLSAFGKATPDLQVVLGNPALPKLARDAAALVVDSDVGPQILYHLGKNPEKAARIARQSPVQQAAAIGRLEAELSIKPSSQKKPTTNITKAPAPPTPTKGNSGAPATDVTKMPMKDFIKMEREQAIVRRSRAR